MTTKVRARESDGYDNVKAISNAGYGYVYAWAGLIDTEIDTDGDKIDDFDKFFYDKVYQLYGWLEEQDDDVQNGAIDALTTLEQNDWDYARSIMNAEIAVIGNSGIVIESDYS